MKKVTATAVVAIAQIKLSLIYITNAAGTLFSCKPTDFPAVQKNAKLIDSLTVLKHNPTCVYVLNGVRVSTEEERPMYHFDGKIWTKRDKAAEQVKVAKAIAGGKTVQVVNDGPQTIYLRLGKDATRPVSMTNEMFEKFKGSNKADRELATRFMTALKHNPTCVEQRLELGLVSTETRRPMFNYDIKTNALTQVYLPGQEPKVEVATNPKAKAKGKAKAAPVAETPAADAPAEQPAAEVVAEAQA